MDFGCSGQKEWSKILRMPLVLYPPLQIKEYFELTWQRRPREKGKTKKTWQRSLGKEDLL